MWRTLVFATLFSLAASVTMADAKLNVVVVFDGSGSMGESMPGGRKIEVAKQALLAVLQTVPKDSNVGIICFSSNSNGWIYPLHPLQYEAASQVVAHIRAGGRTPLGQYMRDAADALIEQRKKDRYGLFRLLVVTDGEATDDAETPLRGENGILSKGITVSAIGVNMSAKHSLATMVSYRNAINPEGLKTAIAAVFAESSAGIGGKEDFELLAGLDDGVAKEVLKALSTYDNASVGQKAPPPITYDVNGGAAHVVEEASCWLVLWVLIAVCVAVCVVIYLYKYLQCGDW